MELEAPQNSKISRVKVALRIRPLIEKELIGNEEPCITQIGDSNEVKKLNQNK